MWLHDQDPGSCMPCLLPMIFTFICVYMCLLYLWLNSIPFCVCIFYFLIISVVLQQTQEWRCFFDTSLSHTCTCTPLTYTPHSRVRIQRERERESSHSLHPPSSRITRSSGSSIFKLWRSLHAFSLMIVSYKGFLFSTPWPVLVPSSTQWFQKCHSYIQAPVGLCKVS